MSLFLNWILLKRDLLEIWLLNGTVAFISLGDIQSMFSIALIALTGAYTIYKWRRDVKTKKSKTDESKH